MKSSLKVSRSLQLFGALLLIIAIVSGATAGIDGSGRVGGLIAGGLLLIIGARIFEWLTKE